MAPRNECVDRVLEELERYGLQGTVNERGKHLEIAWEYKDGQRRQTFVPRTASDWRSSLNARGDVRKTLRKDGIQMPTTTIVSFQKAMNLPKMPTHGLTKEQALQKDVDSLIELVFELTEKLESVQDRINNMRVVTTVTFDNIEIPVAVPTAQETVKQDVQKSSTLVKHGRGSSKDAVLALLSFERWTARADIVKALGKENTAIINQALLRLKKANLVELGLRGMYRRKALAATA